MNSKKYNTFAKNYKNKGNIWEKSYKICNRNWETQKKVSKMRSLNCNRLIIN